MKQICSIDRGVCCVYEIYNQRTEKRYVGSTYRYRNRFREHRKLLLDGSHHSRHLQRSFDKHGTHAFLFRPLEVVPSKSDLFSREQWWIDRFGRSAVYNASMVAGQAGIQPRPIFAIDPKSGKKTRYESAEHAAIAVCRDVNLPRSAARKLGKSAGMFWTYSETDSLESILRARKRRDMEKLAARPHKVFAFTKDGSLVASYATATEAAEAHGTSGAAISQSIRSKRFRTAAGMVWNDSPEPRNVKTKKVKAVRQIKDGFVVRVWASCVEAASAIPGVNHKGISSAATGYTKSHRGYQWEFVRT